MTVVPVSAAAQVRHMEHRSDAMALRIVVIRIVIEIGFYLYDG